FTFSPSFAPFSLNGSGRLDSRMRLLLVSSLVLLILNLSLQSPQKKREDSKLSAPPDCPNGETICTEGADFAFETFPTTEE
ncbi:hypothetical protein PENTCL1PPCAC_2643, partial [Pristionchus entomophagus]